MEGDCYPPSLGTRLSGIADALTLSQALSDFMQ
jgi:hypothetical protein